MDFGRLGVVRRVCGGTGAALPLLVEGAAGGSHSVLLLHNVTTEGGDEYIVDVALLCGAWLRGAPSTVCFVGFLEKPTGESPVGADEYIVEVALLYDAWISTDEP